MYIILNNDELYASTTDSPLPTKLPTYASTQVPTYPTTIWIKIIKNKNKKRSSEMTQKLTKIYYPTNTHVPTFLKI